jgi:hypothetical protein
MVVRLASYFEDPIMACFSQVCLVLFLPAPLGFSRREKPRFVNLLALTDLLFKGEPWPLAASRCCPKSSQVSP